MHLPVSIAVLYLTTALALTGCRASTNLGSGETGGFRNDSNGSTTGGRAPLLDAFVPDAPPPDNLPDCATDAALLQPVSDWDGYASRADFGASGSNRVRLMLPDSLDKPASGLSGGWVLFGEAAPLPAPVSPDECYPACDFDQGVPQTPIRRWHEGFQYPLQRIERDGRYLELEINVHAPWQAWCELQPSTPQPDGGGGFHCTSNDALGYACLMLRDASIPGCCQALLCGVENVCECTEAGCDARHEPGILRLLRLEDGDLQGETDDGLLIVVRPTPAGQPPTLFDAGMPPPGEAGAPFPIDAGFPPMDASTDSAVDGMDASPPLP